jgi:hypothetical protein
MGIIALYLVDNIDVDKVAFCAVTKDPSRRRTKMVSTAREDQ